MNLVELRLKKLGRIKTTKNKMLSNAALMINFHYMSGLKINNKGQKKSQVKANKIYNTKGQKKLTHLFKMAYFFDIISITIGEIILQDSNALSSRP